MTQQDSIKHWRGRSRSELEMARSLLQEEREDFRAGALFHCSLSLELGLKAKFIEEHKKNAPYTHDLVELAHLINEQWTEKQLTAFEDLSEFAVLCRYGDEQWLEEKATTENVNKWIDQVDNFISLLWS